MTRPRDPAAVVGALCAGDRGALARALSLVEQGGPPAAEVGRRAWAQGGAAYTVGLTGPPGAGKSTLTNAVIAEVRATGDQVAVLAVDPTSPFTGGAILGDRIRMQDHALDPGVFIRSMASRGHLGGLALATPQAVRVLDAAGFPWVVLETVGVGQVEVEVAGTADTTVVVLNPGWGDSIQANKAGLLEIADVFVINKADRPGVEEVRSDLRAMLELSETAEGAWRPPIVAAQADKGLGVDELWAAVGEHRAWLAASGELDRRRDRRLRDEVRAIVVRTLEARVYERVRGAVVDALLADVRARSTDPYTAAERIIEGIS